MSNHETRTVATEDGRELEVLVAGAPDGFPLVFHHWVPGSAVPFPTLERPAADRGLRVVSYSRPGCGTSTPRVDADRAPAVADDATDTAAVLTSLGLGDFVTLGWSGGAMRPLACAATLPDRCRAAACLASPAPHGVEGLDPFAGLTAESPEELVAQLLEASDEQALETLRGTFGPALTGEVGDYALACVRHSLHQGVVGWRDDDRTHNRPWGLELADIGIPVSIWHGTEDRNVSVEHGRWLSEHIPTAQAHIIEGADHVSLVLRIDEVLDDLVERAGLNRPASARANG